MLITLVGCQQQVVEEQETSAEQDIDTIPDISITDCLTQIKQTNPEISDQAASDNCWTIEAVNKGDSSLCDEVSSSLKSACLAQFGDTAGETAADEVDVIPDISITDCLAQIKQTNPEMSDQDVNDNCWTIEAVNKGDSSLCDEVSEELRSVCLAQFE